MSNVINIRGFSFKSLKSMCLLLPFTFVTSNTYYALELKINERINANRICVTKVQHALRYYYLSTDNILRIRNGFNSNTNIMLTTRKTHLK